MANEGHMVRQGPMQRIFMHARYLNERRHLRSHERLEVE